MFINIHYKLLIPLSSSQEESLDIVRSGASCEKDIAPASSAVGRAGAVSDYAHRRVLLCGGRDHQGEVRADCLAYDPKTNEWDEHNSMLAAREEAAATTVSVTLRPTDLG